MKAFAEDAEPLSPGDFIGQWMSLMAPAMEKIGPRGELSETEYLIRLEQANVANSLDNLLTFPRLRKLIETDRVSIHGAYFGVATGDLLLRISLPEHSYRLRQTLLVFERQTSTQRRFSLNH